MFVLQSVTLNLTSLSLLSLVLFLTWSGDPHHRASAHQDGVDAQPLGAQSDHGDGGGGSRSAAAHHQRGSHRLSDVRHAGQHGPQDRLLREQVSLLLGGAPCCQPRELTRARFMKPALRFLTPDQGSTNT